MTQGTYATEADAINAALSKKLRGALIVRVTNKNGAVVFSS